MSGVIKQFTGQWKFLSNFWPCRIEYEGVIYPSSEHAYQAAKTCSPGVKRMIAGLSSPALAKRKGRQIEITNPIQWEGAKVLVMEEIVTAKFIQSRELAGRLLATRDKLLQEGNTWGDTFWGIDLKTSEGENHLGIILMNVRSRLKYEAKKT